jgi:hypothetical protein
MKYQGQGRLTMSWPCPFLFARPWTRTANATPLHLRRICDSIATLLQVNDYMV